MLLAYFKRVIASLVIFLLAQVGPAKEETPKPPQGVELLFPVDGGAVTKDKEKDAKVEKAAKRRAALLKKLKAIEEGGDINAADKKGQTALMLAAAANDRLAVCWLVAKGVNVSLKNKKGKTARDLSTSIAVRELLRLAANEKKPLTEEEKVRYDVDTKPTKDQLQQSLSHAMPYVEDLANLIKMGATATAWGVDGRSLLEKNYEAVPESIAWLARKGVDFAERGKDGTWTGGQDLTPPAVLRLLLALGAEPDPQKDSPRTCLQVAMEKDDTPGIQAALKKAPELAKKDWRDFLPYIHSRIAVKAFIAGGFDPKDEWVIPSFADSSESCEALAALFEAGATLSPEHDLQAMINTISSHHGVFIPQLIAAGGDPNKDDSELLGEAVWYSDIQSLRILLEAGTKVSPKSNPLNKLFRWRTMHTIHIGGAAAYMDFPSRGMGQWSDWREHCERTLATRDIIEVLSKAGCQVPDSLPCKYLNSFLLWGRHECPDLPPSMVNMLGSPESPEKTIRELLKLSGNKNALFAGPLVDPDRSIFTTAELIRIANLFLDAGADPKTKENGVLTPLMGIGSRDAALCKRLLAAGANPKADDGDGVTALHTAINTEIAQILLDAWGNINIQEIEKKKPILSYYLKTYDKHRDTLALCKFWKEHGANCDFDLSDIPYIGYGYPAGELLEMLKLVVGGENLASYRTQKTQGSLLHVAAKERHMVELVRLLLKAGVDVNAKDKDGETPLMRAAYSDQETFKFLLQNGADINAQNNDGNTCLMRIVYSAALYPEHKLTLCRLLLDSGARTDIKNKNGKTALQLAREEMKGNRSPIYNEIVKLLEAHGAKE